MISGTSTAHSRAIKAYTHGWHYWALASLIAFGLISPKTNAIELPSFFPKSLTETICARLLSKRTTRKALGVLKAEGVHARVDPKYPNAIVVMPEGDHHLNRIAADFAQEHDGLKFVILADMDGAAFYAGLSLEETNFKLNFWDTNRKEYFYQSYFHSLNIGFNQRNQFFPKHPLFQHELEHVLMEGKKIKGELPPVLLSKGELFTSKESPIEGLSGKKLRPVSTEEIVVTGKKNLASIAQAIQELRPMEEDIASASRLYLSFKDRPDTFLDFRQEMETKSYKEMSLTELLFQLYHYTTYLHTELVPILYLSAQAKLAETPRTIEDYSGRQTTWYEVSTMIPRTGHLYFHMVFDGTDQEVHQKELLIMGQNLHQVFRLTSKIIGEFESILMAPEKPLDQRYVWLDQVTLETLQLLKDPELLFNLKR